jgi:hypothetical protein
MTILARGFATVLVFLAAYLFLYWTLFVQIFPDRLESAANIAAMLAAAAAGFWTWTKIGSGQTGLMASVLKWAMVLGAVGFCAGFFGPMLLAPGANQGPLLGIFITGPLGFVAGAVLRLGYALWQRLAASP